MLDILVITCLHRIDVMHSDVKLSLTHHHHNYSHHNAINHHHQDSHHPHPHPQLWQTAKKLLCTEVYTDKGQSIRGGANCLTPDPIASLAPCSYIYPPPLCKSIFHLTTALWTS